MVTRQLQFGCGNSRIEGQGQSSTTNKTMNASAVAEPSRRVGRQFYSTGLVMSHRAEPCVSLFALFDMSKRA